MYATFVLPAPQGCNLHCPYCAVALRNEASKTTLTNSDYRAFLEGALAFSDLKQVSIVGYEPTLDDAIELTMLLLAVAKNADIATSMNTNGVNFPKYAGRLAPVVDTVMISLDSSIPETNDHMRGAPGTFAATTKGIRSAVSLMGADRVVVNSLLISGERLASMPTVLAGLGVKKWVISPYIDFRHGKLKNDADIHFIRQSVYLLSTLADKANVTMYFADEFGVIGPIREIPIFNFQRPGTPGEFVFRLAPNGTCSVGDEILTDSSVAAVWGRHQDAGAFLQQLRSK
jgi:MoaA/NifB/PqqE/SkfB family radical SAM enzyme